MYIEQRIENLFNRITDLHVQNTDRLARLETNLEAINAHLEKMNGSIAKSVDRLGELEAQDKVTALGIARLSGTVDSNETDIAMLKAESTYSKGKTAGIALIVSFIGTIVASVIGWFIHHPHGSH